MISDHVYRRVGVERSQRLPAFTDLGGYTLVYYTQDGAEMCPACVNGENDSDVQSQDDPQWNVVEADVYWEGPTLYCSHCNSEIESAYGDPNAEKEDED